jgi:hypothetical protein
MEIPKERQDRRAERRLGSVLRYLGYVSGTVRIGTSTPDETSQVARRWRLKE